MIAKISYERGWLGHPELSKTQTADLRIWCASVGNYVVRVFSDGRHAVLFSHNHQSRGNNTVSEHHKILNDFPEGEEGDALRAAFVKYKLEGKP